MICSAMPVSIPVLMYKRHAVCPTHHAGHHMAERRNGEIMVGSNTAVRRDRVIFVPYGFLCSFCSRPNPAPAAGGGLTESGLGLGAFHNDTEEEEERARTKGMIRCSMPTAVSQTHTTTTINGRNTIEEKAHNRKEIQQHHSATCTLLQHVPPPP